MAESRHLGEEATVDFAAEKHESLGRLVGGPGDRWEVGIGNVSATEDLVAVPGRIANVDGGTPRDAVTGWAELHTTPRASKGVARSQDLAPIADEEGVVMQLSV